MQCNIIQSPKELRSAVEKEINDTLSTVPGCHACVLKEVTVPGCESIANQNRRSVDQATEVLFSLLVKSVDSSSTVDNVEETSEAVLFQMQYAVATGQFTISLHGMNSTADRSSLKHLFTNITCSAGFVKSKTGYGCGKHHLNQKKYILMGWDGIWQALVNLYHVYFSETSNTNNNLHKFHIFKHGQRTCL